MKRVDERRIKTNRNYTAEEAAERLSVHPHTIRLWEKRGLKPTDLRRPRLYRGDDLKAFIKANKVSQKKPAVMARCIASSAVHPAVLPSIWQSSTNARMAEAATFKRSARAVLR